LSIIDIVNYIKSLGIDAPVYPLAFPASSPDRCIIVEVGNGTQPKGVVSDIILTITARDIHPSQAEALAQELIDKLHNKTNVQLGDTTAILIKAQQYLPSPLGKDVENRYFYSVNFRVLV
jgi:hypothetical protein